LQAELEQMEKAIAFWTSALKRLALMPPKEDDPTEKWARQRRDALQMTRGLVLTAWAEGTITEEQAVAQLRAARAPRARRRW
jgi:hypothetical protein